MFFISTELTVCSWSSLWRSKSGILTATTELFLVVYCFFVVYYLVSAQVFSLVLLTS